MKILQGVLALLAVAVTGLWAWHTRSWDAVAAFIAALVTFASLGGTMVVRRFRTRSRMSQRVGRNSVAIQSGRDTTIGAKKKQR